MDIKERTSNFVIIANPTISSNGTWNKRCVSGEIITSAQNLWDGITDILSQRQIDTLERLYSKELKTLGIL
jgi:hypothetical protein